MIPLSACGGCRDDFYNGHNPMGVKRCWLAKDGRMVTRYRIGWWTQPTSPGAFTKVRVPNCYHQPGVAAYCADLPSYVRAADLNRKKLAARATSGGSK